MNHSNQEQPSQHPINEAIANFIDGGLFLDLEVNPTTGEITQIGAIFGGKKWLKNGGEVQRALSEIEQACTAAKFIAGHNLIAHDLEFIRACRPLSSLLRLPVIDTLILSTLAYPKRPFHALTKNYKSTGSEQNNPVLDSANSKQLLTECLARFLEIAHSDSRRIHFYAGILGGPSVPTNEKTTKASCLRNQWMGFKGCFAAIGIPTLSTTAIYDHWHAIVADHGCLGAADELILHQLRNEGCNPVPLAFAAAWMSADDATFPPWALHQYQETIRILRRLRGTNCGKTDCSYCARINSPVARLRELFPKYQEFRPHPEVRGRPGVSLQGELVRIGMEEEPLLGILPTGGGKSLCFQIPALHRHRTRGALTVVISPLQSLMRDQVDNLVQRVGIHSAGALYGGISAPDRRLLMDDVASGAIGILYISPEQLRNPGIIKLLRLREIGAWVFDEAHCLAKWGHDFRPDYQHVSRVIRELADAQHAPIPPIQAFTATAKADVRDEIIEHFADEKRTNQELQLLDGGSERTNLAYSVEEFSDRSKPARILELLEEQFEGDQKGSAIIFCAKRKAAEDIATFLNENGYPAGFFHAGIEDPEEKRKIQDRFMSGELRIMAATNAFGMGVDKDDVRLVIHHKMPGSLENYLQEAGRAGRDGMPARSILLYDEKEDCEEQFNLLESSKLSEKELAGILRVVRSRAKASGRSGTAVLSAKDISDAVSPPGDQSACLDPTDVKSAIAHLERCELLQRDENQNRVLQVRPLVKDLTEANVIISRLSMPDDKRTLWRSVMGVVLSPQIQNPADFLDALCGLSEMQPIYDRLRRERPGREPNEIREVIRILTEMSGRSIGLLVRDVTFSAIVKTANNRNPSHDSRLIGATENALMACMTEKQPDFTDGTHVVDLKAIAAAWNDNEVRPEILRRIIFWWAKDLYRVLGKEYTLVAAFHGGGTTGTLKSSVGWPELQDAVGLRQAVSSTIAKHLLDKAHSRQKLKSTAASGEDQEVSGSLIEFTDTDLVEALRGHMATAELADDLPRATAVIHHALVRMDAFSAIQLIQGKAIITSAMTLRVPPDSTKRKYQKGDHAPMEAHHAEKRLQVHVISKYAKTFADNASEAKRLLVEYFVLSKAALISHYFLDDPDQVKLATGLESYRNIARDLSSTQSSIVFDSDDKNLMILAGPGSGKTRVLVHRIAFLLKVKRIRPERIAALCFNRSAAIELRTRLHDLAGPIAARVTVSTYHGMAVRLTGKSPKATESAADGAGLFNEILREATALLAGGTTPMGEDEALFLQRMQCGFSHIFVDEYQDINEHCYRFVAALVGKGSANKEERPCLTAVGDDDQSIYKFNGAEVGFIRQFESDYKAERQSLLENYRSTQTIISVSNAWIDSVSGRMKSEPIRINKKRDETPQGGEMETQDKDGRGRVRLFSAVSDFHAEYLSAHLAIQELRRIRQFFKDTRLPEFAVIAPTHEALAPIRHLMGLGRPPIPLVYRQTGFPLHRERECLVALAELEANPTRLIKSHQLAKQLKQSGSDSGNAMADLLNELEASCEEAQLPAAYVARYLRDGLGELNSGQRLSDGVVLTTVHGAKGLEFDHVFLLDAPKWPGASVDENRRLLYVAMTRARKSLSLFTRKEAMSPFFADLSSISGINAMDCPVAIRDPDPRLRYTTIGMGDLAISYLGWHEKHLPANRKISNLKPGSYVAFLADAKHVHITSEGVKIARLAHPGKAECAEDKKRREFLHQLVNGGKIHSAKISAFIQCRRADSVPDPKLPKIQHEQWEIPIIDVVYSA